jgi:Activator of Hsp90 ATPase homolog 1-like protein
MSERVVIAPVQKLVRVRAPIGHAFAVFTSGLTRWWPHTHGVGRKPIAKVLIEPKLGGRWLEIAEDGTETPVATITIWEPPHRFVMLWQVDAHWKPDAAMRSEVDVRFFAEGAEATRVELLHHKFETMGDEAGASMRKDVDGGWPGLLQHFLAEAERAPSSS